MVKFSVPEGSSAKGPKVSELLDLLLAIHVRSDDWIETKFSEGKKQHRVLGRTWALDLEHSTAELKGDVSYFQDVLIERLCEIDVGAWLVGWLIQPGQAYLFEPPTDEEMPAVGALMETFDDDEPIDDVEPDDDTDDDEFSF